MKPNSMTFVAGSGAAAGRDGDSGLHVCIKVDDIDGYHAGVRANGLEPDGEPVPSIVGKREFGLRDPDGNRLRFFTK